MADANEICQMDTVTLAGRIKAKELSPVEVVEAVLGRWSTWTRCCTHSPP